MLGYVLLWFVSSQQYKQLWKNSMGCTSSIITQQKIQPSPCFSNKQTAYIQSVIPDSEIKVQPNPSPDNIQVASNSEILNTKMKKQKEKIHFLQQSQYFMRESVEISTCVHQAIISLTYNPLLHDEAYYKLIGVNKKTLEKKQNRMNNLLKRQQKAQQELKKQKEKRLEKTRSEFINYRFNTTKQQNNRQINKQNKEQIIYRTLSKASFAQKMSKVQHELFGTSKNIM